MARTFNRQVKCQWCRTPAKKQTETWWTRQLGEYKGNLQIIRTRTEWDGSKTLTLWDGESYELYAGNFCTNRCAISFANQVTDRLMER